MLWHVTSHVTSSFELVGIEVLVTGVLFTVYYLVGIKLVAVLCVLV